MENNFTVNANIIELFETLDSDAKTGIVMLTFAVLGLLCIICSVIIEIYIRYDTTSESPDNTTLITKSAVSNTETTNNSTTHSTSPPISTRKGLYKSLYIMEMFGLTVQFILHIYIGIDLITCERNKTAVE